MCGTLLCEGCIPLTGIRVIEKVVSRVNSFEWYPTGLHGPVLQAHVHFRRQEGPQKRSAVYRVGDRKIRLQDEAPLLLLLLGQESSTCGMLEDLANTLIGLCGTLKVFVTTNLLADFLTLSNY